MRDVRCKRLCPCKLSMPPHLCATKLVQAGRREKLYKQKKLSHISTDRKRHSPRHHDKEAHAFTTNNERRSHSTDPLPNALVCLNLTREAYRLRMRMPPKHVCPSLSRTWLWHLPLTKYPPYLYNTNAHLMTRQARWHERAFRIIMESTVRGISKSRNFVHQIGRSTFFTCHFSCEKASLFHRLRTHDPAPI